MSGSTTSSALEQNLTFSGSVSAYALRTRAIYAVCVAILALLVAGFWNPRLVDGFGRNVVAARTIGDPDALGGTFGQNGFGFGFLFAAIAGLAATFTACNCVVFAMLPGLAAGGQASSRRSALTALGVFATGVVLVGAAYGMFIGWLGPAGIEAFNSPGVRRAQAMTVFTVLGTLMLAWGLVELGFLERLTGRASPTTRAFFAQPTAKAGMLGFMVGMFMIGRPFPVMRDFLIYAASANNPLYGAGVMAVQGLGQITVMVLVFLALAYGTGRRLPAWIARAPERASLLTGLSLIAGGTFFVFYWGLAFAYGVGRWGFRLGWYS